MNEENENQPAPLETQSASPEQRHPRPRRRFPRRRYRGDRFRPDNSEESPNSSSVNANNAGGDVAVETLDQPGSAGREAAEGAGETGEQVQAEPEFGEGIIEISGKGFRVSARSETQFCPDAAGYLCHPGNCAPFRLARRDVDQRRNPARQPWPAIDEAADDQWRGADEISGASPV